MIELKTGDNYIFCNKSYTSKEIIAILRRLIVGLLFIMIIGFPVAFLVGTRIGSTNTHRVLAFHDSVLDLPIASPIITIDAYEKSVKRKHYQATINTIQQGINLAVTLRLSGDRSGATLLIKNACNLRNSLLKQMKYDLYLYADIVSEALKKLQSINYPECKA